MHDVTERGGSGSETVQPESAYYTIIAFTVYGNYWCSSVIIILLFGYVV